MSLSWIDQRMYIEELIIDDYERQVREWESLSDDDRWDKPEPEKPDVVTYYEERGEYGDEEAENESIAPDIMTMGFME